MQLIETLRRKLGSRNGRASTARGDSAKWEGAHESDGHIAQLFEAKARLGLPPAGEYPYRILERADDVQVEEAPSWLVAYSLKVVPKFERRR